jgi:hypothetical protein
MRCSSPVHRKVRKHWLLGSTPLNIAEFMAAFFSKVPSLKNPRLAALNMVIPHFFPRIKRQKKTAAKFCSGFYNRF